MKELVLGRRSWKTSWNYCLPNRKLLLKSTNPRCSRQQLVSGSSIEPNDLANCPGQKLLYQPDGDLSLLEQIFFMSSAENRYVPAPDLIASFMLELMQLLPDVLVTLPG